MKKVKANHLLYGAGVLMVLGFIIQTVVDYVRYDDVRNSAPFWVFICINALYWLLPAALAVLAGFIANQKLINKEKKQ